MSLHRTTDVFFELGARFSSGGELDAYFEFSILIGRVPNLQHEFARDMGSEFRLLEPHRDVLGIDVGAIERYGKPRAPKDVNERQPSVWARHRARASHRTHRSRVARKLEHVVERDDSALIEDSVTNEGRPCIAGEQELRAVSFEIPMVRVILTERGEPLLTEELVRGCGVRRQEPTDRNRQRGLVSEYAAVGGAIERCRKPEGIGGAKARGEQRAPLFAEYLARGDQAPRRGISNRAPRRPLRRRHL